MNVRPIRTDKEHRASLREIEALWGAVEGSAEGDKLDLLLALVEIYEAKRWLIDSGEDFDPVDALRYAIEELGHTQAELADLLGIPLPRVGNPLAPARPLQGRCCQRRRRRRAPIPPKKIYPTPPGPGA